MHTPMGGGFSTKFKSSNRIELSWLVQVLLNFDWFWGPPLRVGRWLDSVGVGVGMWRGTPCTHMHMHVHTHMYVKHDKHGCLHVGGHLQFLYMYTCVCACTCICMHVGTPHMSTDASRHPPPTCPLPRAAGSPKHQNSVSLELIKIFWFCLKILYL